MEDEGRSVKNGGNHRTRQAELPAATQDMGPDSHFRSCLVLQPAEPVPLSTGRDRLISIPRGISGSIRVMQRGLKKCFFLSLGSAISVTCFRLFSFSFVYFRKCGYMLSDRKLPPPSSRY